MDDLNTTQTSTQFQAPIAASTAGPPDDTGTEASAPILGPSLLVWEPDTPYNEAHRESLRHAHAHVTYTNQGPDVTIHANNTRSEATGVSKHYPIGTRVTFEAGDGGPYEDDGTVFERVIEEEVHDDHVIASDCYRFPSCARQTTTIMPLYFAAPNPDNNFSQRQQRLTDIDMAESLLRNRMMRCSTHNDVE